MKYSNIQYTKVVFWRHFLEHALQRHLSNESSRLAQTCHWRLVTWELSAIKKRGEYKSTNYQSYVLSTQVEHTRCVLSFASWSCD